MIFFLRHGQTAVNRAGRLQGRVDAPLTELGVAQAEAVAGALSASDAAVRRVVSSPSVRARDTAAPIARAYGLPVDVDDRLVELDYGEWDERPLRELDEREWARWRADPEFAPPGGESLAAVGTRVAGFCDDVDFGGTGDVTVAVSHVSPIKAAVCWALGVDASVTWRLQLDLASVTRVGRRPDGRGYLASYNETFPPSAIRP